MEKLQVPENITLRWELWQGVGKPELAAILIVTAVAAVPVGIFCALSSAKNGMPIMVFCLVIVFAFACGFFTKLDGNQSICDFIRRQARYKKEQQIFYYVRHKGGCFRAEKEGC